MKAKLLALSLLILYPFGVQADDPKAGYHGMAGPNGGRLLVEVEPHLEFLVNTVTKKVEICFIGDANIVQTPGGQEVVVTIGTGANASGLTFTRDGDKLVSDKAVPEGNDLPVIVQVRAKPAEPLITADKFILSLTLCPAGKHPQYACTCAPAQPKEKK
jgi:hypothetical protein